MGALKWLDKNFEEFLLMVLLAVMVVIMGVQVVMRYAFNASLVWSEEITRYMFVWSTFLSLGFCIKRGASIKITQFTDMMSESSMGRKVIGLAVKVVMLVCFIILLKYAFVVVGAAYRSGQSSPAMGIPMYMIQSSTVVGFALATIRCIQSVFGSLKAFKGDKPTQYDY